jgi:hypothetical protein
MLLAVALMAPALALAQTPPPEAPAEPMPTAAPAAEVGMLGQDQPAVDAAASPAPGGTDQTMLPDPNWKPKDDSKDEPAWKKKTKIRPRGHIHALFMLRDAQRDGQDVPSSEFSVRSARIGLAWRHARLIDGEVEVELGDEEGTVFAGGILRDGYVRVSPLAALRIRMGHFKRPFSRMRLRPRRSLRLINRGLANQWIVEELGYGDRDLGLQLEGRFGDQTGLEYRVGVFNGEGPNAHEVDENGSKDVVARVEAEPTEWLSIGHNVSYKRFDEENRDWERVPRSALMGGADFGLRVERLRVLGDCLYGQNYLLVEGGYSASALLLAAYKIPLAETWELALEPLAKGEVLVPEVDLRNGQVWMWTAGANLHIGDYLRLMLQGEMVRPRQVVKTAMQDWGPWETVRTPATWSGDENRLMLQAAFSTR